MQPTAIKYVYTRDMSGQVEASLGRLERRLRLAPPLDRAYDRLARIAAAVVGTLEREFGVRGTAGEPIEPRIERLRDVMLRRLASALNLELPRGDSFTDQLRAVTNAYDDALYGGHAEESEYQRAVREQALEAVRSLYVVWNRLRNFLAVDDGYVAELPSAERFLDVLGRLEIEVLGRSGIRGPRRAVLSAGEPLDLAAHLDAYRAHKRETTARLTHELEGSVMSLLTGLMEQTRPVAALAAAAG